MSAGWQFNRSDEHLARRFSTVVDGVRRLSRAERADHYSIENNAHGLRKQMASAMLGLGHEAWQRANIGRAQAQPSDINRHRR